jgi:hypothetical protein
LGINNLPQSTNSFAEAAHNNKCWYLGYCVERATIEFALNGIGSNYFSMSAQVCAAASMPNKAAAALSSAPEVFCALHLMASRVALNGG